MSFVLSRNDIPETSKYTLKDRVVQIIGRGSLRDCNDPRISREHASVTTEGDTLILRALHLKPCFYRRSISDAISKLSLGESVELFHGDYFGLLPETNWYELIYTKKEDAENDNNKPEAVNKNIQPDPNETKNDEQSTPTKRPHTPDQGPGAKKIKTEPESPMKEGTDPTSNVPVRNDGSSQALTQDEGTAANNKYAGEAIDETAKDKEHVNTSNAESLDPNDTANSDDVNQAGGENEEHQSLAMATDISNNNVNVSKHAPSDLVVKKEPGTPTKESAVPLETSDEHETLVQSDLQGSDTDVPSSGSEMDVKKEPGIAKADDVKKEPQSPDVQRPGTSKDQPGQNGPSNDGAAAAPPNARPRERCLYGADCYRKNPQHKLQFSHPGDADYGPGEKAACPYGAQCRRTDPRHWLAHSHPRGTLPPQQHRNGIRVVQRRGQFFYINAHAVHFHENHYAVEDEDGQRVDYDYEF